MASISDLLEHIRNFVGIFHRTKTDKDNYWKSLINQTYQNGRWYIQEDVNNNQNIINLDGPVVISRRSQYIYYLSIKNFNPTYYHSSQICTSYLYRNDELYQTKTISLSNPSSYSTIGSNISASGTYYIKIVVSPYTINGIIYSGVTYKTNTFTIADTLSDIKLSITIEAT